MSGSLADKIPGYSWGTEQAPPADAETADRVETKVTYGVMVHEDGAWRWSAVNLPAEWAHVAVDHAIHYTGIHAPVPVLRRVVEVTRTYYVWGQLDRVAVAETHAVVTEHAYTGPSDPFADPELVG